jgi:C4-dicarboxylate-specific signal transduction histidine kinase
MAESLQHCQETLAFAGVELANEVGDVHLEIDCRPVQITQVLVNLIGNALDAVKAVDERWIRLEVRDLGDEVEVAVVDSGRGVPPELRLRVLQPFFTTKGPGGGMGLGLSIAAGVAADHRGRLYYDESSRATRFAFRHPKRQDSSEAAMRTSA